MKVVKKDKRDVSEKTRQVNTLEQNREILDKVANDVVDKHTKLFIKPMSIMQQSVDDDSQYLLALGEFISLGQRERELLLMRDKKFEAARLNVELLDAIGKYQANENLLKEKKLHFDQVFLPRYNKELQDSKENFATTLKECRELIDENQNSENRFIGFIKKEVKFYDDYFDKEEEFDNHTYKILKRLLNTYKDEEAKK
jgi:hypothetical protein